MKFNLPAGYPVVVSDGMGVDSTAVLEVLADAGIRPDKIQFANTGGEKQETYDYISVRQARMQKLGFPQVDIVRYMPKRFKHWPPYYTLEDNCLTNGTLPSLAFGFKSCSLKWKVAPQDKAVAAWQPAIDAWARGDKVIKIIGYDAGPADIRRHKQAQGTQDPKFHYLYVLIELNIDRAGCVERIKAAGEPVPPKSSCFYCPAMKPEEVSALPVDKLERIVTMEARAEPRLETVEGLWRTSTKGKRGKPVRPGSMTVYIRDRGLLPSDRIQEIRDSVQANILDYQTGYAAALAAGNAEQFLEDQQAKSYLHGQQDF